MINYVEISSLQEENYLDELNMYTGLNENQLYHYYEPDLGLFIAESPKVIIRALNDGYEPVSFFVEKSHLTEEAREVLGCEAMRKMSDYRDINVYICDHELYSSVTGLGMTRGMISVMKRRTLPAVSDVLSPYLSGRSRIAVLDDVENPTNVGAIFRSAAALYMDAVLLTSTCSDPLYRRAARVSMGTVFQVPWTYFSGYTYSKDYYREQSGEQKKKDPSYRYIEELHDLGYKVCAMALTDQSISLRDPILDSEEKLAIILGNEGVGLPSDTIAQCDYTVMIPMSHEVDSLNVAAASAVAFYALNDRKMSD